MKKYQYLASWDDQTLTRVSEPVVVLGDSNVSQVEVTMPSNFLLDPTGAVARMYFLLPGEKESDFETLETATQDENGDYHVTWTIKHAHTQKGGRLAFSLTLIGDNAQWDSRTAILPVYESRYQPEREEAEESYTGRLAALEGSMAAIRGEFAEVQEAADEATETASAASAKADSAITKADAVDERLDNIIIESGTSEAEVVAARTNSDTGTTYNTLGARLDTEYSEIKEDLSAQSLVTGGKSLTFLKDKYYRFTNSAGNVSFEPTNYTGRNGAISPCVEGDIFLVTVQGAGAAAIGWAFADAEGVVLARSATNVVANNVIITAPAGSAYAVFNETKNSPVFYAVKLSKNTVKNYLGYASLNVLAIGDSICRGGRNGGKGFIGNVGCRYVNMGVGGATLTNTHDVSSSTDTLHPVGASDIPDQLVKYAASTGETWYIEPDAIIADGGTNDYVSATLGTVPTVPVKSDEEASALDRSTIAGALGFLFWNMIKLYPLAHRYFLLTNRLAHRPFTAGAMGYTQTEEFNLIKSVCKVYGVEVIDVFSRSPVDSYYTAYVSPTAYSTDNTVTDLYCIDNDKIHPLALGYKVGYVPYVRDALRSALDT